MPVEIFELDSSFEQSVGATEPNLVRHYLVRGTEDPDEANAVVKFTLPAFTGEKPFRFYRLQPQGGDVWLAEATYGRRLTSFQFDTTGGTQRITTSRKSTYYTKDSAGGIDPDDPLGETGYVDFKHAVLVDEQKVEGVDIHVPQFSFTLRKLYPLPMDAAYLQALFELTGHVNSQPCHVAAMGVEYTFEAGELLYLGTTGGQQGDDDADASMRFSASRNVAGLTFGTGADKISGVSKDGWDFLWVRFQDVANAVVGAPALIKKPVQVCIEQVYPRSDLNVLFTQQPGPPDVVHGPEEPIGPVDTGGGGGDFGDDGEGGGGDF